MFEESVYQTDNIELFKKKALQWASFYDTACCFDSNDHKDVYSAFDVLIAAGSRAELTASAGSAFHQLQGFIDTHQERVLGFFTYDLKNEIENLSSKNPDNLHFPDLFFFIPLHEILIRGNRISIKSASPDKVFEEINQQEIKSSFIPSNIQIQKRINREEYISRVSKIKQHILRGDIYEMNFCQEFFAENVFADALTVFNQLNKTSPVPFSCFFKHKSQYIISATPERFLCKRSSKLISQPIKGTARRKMDKNEDEQERQKLKSSLKEQSENVMIVDLVRNDLTKSAVPGSVKVEELFGIYSFPQVHQMISTVSCEVKPDLSVTEIIKNAFPMGSMTGAPKIRAMQLIEDYESMKRGLFSGAVGYITPSGDFDFNVIIRTILYNSQTGYLSFQTGSAITIDADAEKEYEECLLKAKAMMEVLTKNPG